MYLGLEFLIFLGRLNFLFLLQEKTLCFFSLKLQINFKFDSYWLHKEIEYVLEGDCWWKKSAVI